MYDAVVIGGGPAGAVAAWELARAGARVIVVERERVPRYKTCGGGVLRRVLDGLPGGLPHEFDRQCRAVEVNLLDTRQRWVVRRPDPVVLMTMRSEFDQALLDRAVEAGAELRDGCAFVSAERRESHLVVTLAGDRLSTRVLLGADGAAGVVGRTCGLGPGPLTVPAVESEIEVGAATVERFGSAARFDFDRPSDGYGWVFPKMGHLSVGVLRMSRGRSGLGEVLADYMRRTGITDVRGEKRHGFVIPVRPRKLPALGGVLLLGDAAGLADPVTAEGITNAARSGALAARAITRAGGAADRATRFYASALRREILPELRIGRVLARLLYGHPRLRSSAFRRLGQPLCEALTDVVTGRRTYRALVARPRHWWGALRAFSAQARPSRTASPIDP